MQCAHGSGTAWYFHGFDRLVRFRFDSVSVWPEAGEQDEREHHRRAETCERDGVGVKTVVSCAHQNHAGRPCKHECTEGVPIGSAEGAQAEVSGDHVGHGLNLCAHAEPDQE